MMENPPITESNLSTDEQMATVLDHPNRHGVIIMQLVHLEDLGDNLPANVTLFRLPQRHDN